MIFALFVSCDKSEGRPRETNAPTTAETSANTEKPPESELDVTDIETDPESETTPDTETEKTETESDKGGENTTEKIETDPETDPETPTDPETDPETDGDGTDGPDAPEINYGTLSAPVTTTYAYHMCYGLENNAYSASPFYVEGKVTEIGETGKYYKNVYFTDGTTNMLIYTINMGEGISGFEVGDTITAYGYVKNYNGTIELATYEGSVYVYAVAVESAGDSAGGDTDDSNHTYTDFTDEEKALFTDRVGFVIPFIPNDEYYVEEYSDDEYGEYGVNFYAFGNSQAEFDAYRKLFFEYSYDGTENDEYGDAWYYYSKGDVCVDMTYYYYEGEYVTDIYVYVLTEDGGSSGEGSDTDIEVDKNLITNNGAGLPEDSDGVYDVDFTKGNYVQNVTEQGYYMDGCPTTGTPAVLVIPVEFSDITAASKGYTVENLEKIFNGVNGDTIYYSVKEYYFASSYNKLDLNVTVLDSWFCPKETSSYYADATYDYYGTEMSIGDQLILDEALAYLSTVMDLSEFDSDKNGMIDAVVMVNTLDIDAEVEFRWAYRYWNVYTDDEGYYFEYDAVSANDYIWMSYQFMFEAYDEETGEVNYDSTNPLNPYTFIHEVGHVLGAEDYYDTVYESSPMNGLDVMDSMMGDHNPYSKFNYGWITDSRLVVTDSTVTLTLEAFEKSGDTLILASNWDESLGAYQEYYVIMYYTETGLNSGEGGYFLRDGVVVYHINSTLYAEDYGDETYYDVYNNNTDVSDESGTKDNLVEYVQSSAGNYTYAEGDTLPEVVDDLGNTLGYTFTVDSVTADCVTITFEKIG